MAENEHDFALVVGINDYPNYGSNGRPLRGAIGDAEEFADWLLDAEFGGGLKPDHCKLIRSSVETVDPPQPQKYRIDAAFQQIWNMSKGLGGGRRFYLYFSGHGQTQTHNDVALCMANWEINRQAAAISFRKYLDLVIRCMNFEEVVILMDCCRTRKVGAKGQESELTCPVPVAGEVRVFIAHATEFQTAAHEADLPGQDNEEAQEESDNDEPIVRGHFTRALITALKGAAASDTGGVSAGKLASYLKKVVPRIASRSGHVQNPVFEIRGFLTGEDDELWFGSAPQVTSVETTIHFRPDRIGPIRLEDPNLDIIRDGPPGAEPWEETLEMARHLLTDLHTGEEMVLELNESTGEIDVEF
ncbi:MAG: caspase family protein [Sedimenticola sp.]